MALTFRSYGFNTFSGIVTFCLGCVFVGGFAQASDLDRPRVLVICLIISLSWGHSLRMGLRYFSPIKVLPEGLSVHRPWQKLFFRRENISQIQRRTETQYRFPREGPKTAIVQRYRLRCHDGRTFDFNSRQIDGAPILARTIRRRIDSHARSQLSDQESISSPRRSRSE
ncbi:MAG: hypothetical protein AAF196_17920 [Planctomycetota bacterium]